MPEQDHLVEQNIFDALPYYDNDLEAYPVLKEKVEQELAREATSTQTLHSRVSPAHSLFSGSSLHSPSLHLFDYLLQENPLLRAELDRVEHHQPLNALDTTRYQLPSPEHDNASDDEWRFSLRNAKAQLEHQMIRQNNLALLNVYGSNSWRIHNYLLEATANNVEKALEELTQKTTDVNRQRKQVQIRLGSQLTSLETRWTELISNVLQVELANAALEAELAELRRREKDLQNL